MNLDRFPLPDEPSDRDMKLNNFYYKRLDLLEDIRALENSLDDAEAGEERAIREEIERLQEEVWETERQIDDVRYWS